MPTDGADFGRMKACYGKAYTALRAGADNAVVAEIVVCGMERDIRRDGGMPGFVPVVELVALISQRSSEASDSELLRGVDQLARAQADFSLTRQLLDSATKVCLGALNAGRALSRHQAAELILAQVGRGRCDGMSAYAAKHRTHSIAAARSLLDSISDKLCSAPNLNDLAGRMLNSSAGGLPARAAKAPRVEHSADALNNTSLEGGL